MLDFMKADKGVKKAEDVKKPVDTRSTASKAMAGIDAVTNPDHKSTKPAKAAPAAESDNSDAIGKATAKFDAIGKTDTPSPALPFKTGPVIGSGKHGIDHVPETGLYKLHEGEKVVSKEENKPEHSSEEKVHFHRAMSHLHGGALHRHLGIPEGEPIPLEKKHEAANSDNPHVAAMGRLAVSMHGWQHPKKS